jgi:hypothetical protein
MYTSGCPKNQNKCWYRTGSPPPPASKKEVFKFRSESNIVIAPANTGKERSSKIAVIKTDQANKGICSRSIPKDRKLAKVLIKFTAPSKEEIPAKCKEKIAQSTDFPLWAILALKGG